MDHENIIKIHSWGHDGKMIKNDVTSENNVYVLIEFISGGIFFDLCIALGGLGEDVGRFYMNQLINILDHMHSQGIAHRDIKLENILVDEELNLKMVV